MTTIRFRGHIVEQIKGVWQYVDIKRREQLSRPCRHCEKRPIAVRVKIPQDLSCSGVECRKWKLIDACIAPIVRALQRGGIDMRGSCCGHGSSIGNIELQDGRCLLIKYYDV